MPDHSSGGSSLFELGWWPVCPEGYHWVHAECDPEGTPVDEGPWLVPRDPWRLEWYDPQTESPELCRKFAELAGEKSAIAEFAGRWGLPVMDQELQLDEDDPETRTVGVPLEAWSYEPARMRMSLSLADALRHADEPALRERVRWETIVPRWGLSDSPVRRIVVDALDSGSAPTIGPAYLASDSVRGTPATEAELTNAFRQQTSLWQVNVPEELIQNWRDGDVFRPAWAVLSDLVNDALYRSASPVLSWAANQPRPHMAILPASLLAAMWLQVLEYANGDREHAQCPACRRWFELAPESARRGKVYCSDGCKSRAYRERSRSRRTAS